MSDPITSPAEDGAGRYTVVYEGNPAANRILNGEPAVGRAVTVGLGDRISRCVAAESRAAAAEAEVVRLREDAERSFQHRNDLSDSIVSLRTEKGALRERVKVLEGALTKIQRNADYGRETYKQDASETGQSLASCWGIIADFARAALTEGSSDDQA